jgi:hypothetical protein
MRKIGQREPGPPPAGYRGLAYLSPVDLTGKGALDHELRPARAR